MTLPANVTIKDVAHAAGVSPKTVSRVINGEAHVRDEVRDRVNQVVRDLDYRPNAFARGLSSSRSFLIGIFFEDPACAYAAEVQRGAMERCRRMGHHLLVEECGPNTGDWQTPLAATLREVRLGGAILTPPMCDMPEVLAMFDQAGVPVVRLSPDLPDDRGPQVRIDDRAAARDLTDALVALGHRRIGFIGGNRAHSSARRRHEGFEDAIAAAGLVASTQHVLWGDFSFRSGLDAGGALLDGSAPPTAVFASNDEMAFGVLVAALHRGVAVPDNLSVVGFDDVPLARMAFPQLTTVRQPNEAMAEAAVELLIGPDYAHRRDEAGLCVTLPYRLLYRDSCVAPPA